MSVDRRSFLGLSAIAAGSAAGRAVPVSDDRYENARLGLGLTKPPGWHWFTRWHYELAKDGYRVPGGQEAKEYLLELAGRPLVVMTSEPPSFVGPCPTIVVWAQHEPESDAKEAVDAHRFTYGVLYGRSLQDFSFEAEPVEYALAERSGSRCVICFTELNEGQPPAPARLVSTMVKNGPFWLTINFIDLASGWSLATRGVFQAFEESIVLS